MTTLPHYNAMPALTPHKTVEEKIIDQMRNADLSTWGSQDVADYTKKATARDAGKEK